MLRRHKHQLQEERIVREASSVNSLDATLFRIMASFPV